MLQIIPLVLGLKVKKIFKLLTSRQKIKDSCKFSLFVALFGFVYKACLCLFRRIALKFCGTEAETDRLAAPLAGFVAGFTLSLDSPFRRQFVAVLALSRFIETSLNLAEGHETIPKVAYKDFYMWLAANLLT